MMINPISERMIAGVLKGAKPGVALKDIQPALFEAEIGDEQPDTPADRVLQVLGYGLDD
jgi:hypothetical protein